MYQLLNLLELLAIRFVYVDQIRSDDRNGKHGRQEGLEYKILFESSAYCSCDKKVWAEIL